MTTARELLNQRAQPQLNDPRGEFWSLNELLQYMNEALQLMIQYAPSEFAVVRTVDLVAGTKQTLPAQGVNLVQVLKNINADGSPGRAAFQTTRRALDLGDPEWQQASAGPIKEWAYDMNDPLIYWVSPPAAAGNRLEIEYIQRPSDMVVNAEVPVRKDYHAPLIDYVLYRAMAKDTDYAGSSGLAGLHQQAFYTGMGVGSGDSG